jgi:PhnB protein
MTAPAAPTGYNTVNPFVIASDAAGLIEFVTAVFGGREVPEAHTLDDDGLILHSEVVIGDSIVMIADRKADWPVTHGLLQVYVRDMTATLAAAAERGARIVTEPTEFYGDVLSRAIDAWGNLWWISQHSGEEPSTEAAADGSNGSGQSEATDWSGDQTDAAEWSSEPTPELTYIHDTLLVAMRGLAP